MQIEQALMTYLLAQSGITGLVGDRIHFASAPQDISTPYIIVSKISGTRQHSHEGADGIASPRFQFSIFDEHYGDCKAVAAQLQASLEGYSGTMGGEGGVVVAATFYEDEVDLDPGDNTGLFGVAADYIVWHYE